MDEDEPNSAKPTLHRRENVRQRIGAVDHHQPPARLKQGGGIPQPAIQIPLQDMSRPTMRIRRNPVPSGGEKRRVGENQVESLAPGRVAPEMKGIRLCRLNPLTETICGNVSRGQRDHGWIMLDQGNAGGCVHLGSAQAYHAR